MAAEEALELCHDFQLGHPRPDPLGQLIETATEHLCRKSHLTGLMAGFDHAHAAYRLRGIHELHLRKQLLQPQVVAGRQDIGFHANPAQGFDALPLSKNAGNFLNPGNGRSLSHADSSRARLMLF